MSLLSLFGRKYPTPVVKPFAPFIIAAGIVLFGVSKIEKAAQSGPPYDTDPRNPKALLNKQLKEHH